MTENHSTSPKSAGPTADAEAARELAVVLHDLAWLLPRTIGLEASRQEPLPQSELEVMRLLARRPGLSVSDVARELGLQASNVSAAIRALVARGLLERRQDETDRRIARLAPTPHAIDMRDRREAAWGNALATRLGAMAGDDTAKLTDAAPALRALAEHLAQGPKATR